MLTMSESTLKEELNHRDVNNVEVVGVEDDQHSQVNNITVNTSSEDVNNVCSLQSNSGNSDQIEEVIDRDIDKSKVQRKFVQIECEYFNGSDIYDSISFTSFSNACSGIKDDDFCKLCSKHVYQMEKINAVKSVFHKTCFRCKECKKQLSADNYFSHEGEVYCTPHFKHLFQPKAKFDSEDQAPIKCDQVVYSYDIYGEQGRQRKYELIIRENTPQELPPDVIRYNSKVDDDFDSLQLDLSNIRNRFELGTNSEPNHNCLSVSDKSSLNRSESVHKIMQKYESAVSGDRKSTSSSDDEEENDNKPNECLESEKAVMSGVASALKSQWEQGKINSNKEDQENTREELANLRQKMCLGRSESMRQVYERACKESKQDNKSDNPVVIFDSTVKTESIKEKFEKGKVDNETEEEKMERLKKEREEELSMFAESDTASKEARNKFKQIDASASKGVVSPTNHNNVSSHFNHSNGHTTKYQQLSNNNNEVIKCGDPIEKDDINIDPNQLQERFAYFENLKDVQKEPKRFQITPPRELKSCIENDPEANRDPNVIRSCDIIEDIPKVDTTKKMLDKFKELENRKENELSSVKPPKHRVVTKPENGTDVEQDKARTLKAKFENWSVDIDRENKRNAGYDDEEEYIPHIDTTKNLRAKFEAIKDEHSRQQSSDKPKPRVNRFVHEFGAIAASDLCSVCGTRLYPMERMEFSGIKLHKNCFRCVHCSSSLRLDNYTTTAGKMYCIPHFKQLFMAKGNYDEGFGLEQHKDKWAHKSNNNNLYNNNNNNNFQISSRNSSSSSDENDNENENENESEAQYTAHEYSEPLDNDY